MKLKIFIVLLILQTIQVFVNGSINCIVCNSKIKNCATANGLERYSQECYSNETSCFTGIDQSGGTVRGCGTGSNIHLNMVLPCMGNICNVDLYPKNRHTCHQCKNGLLDCMENLTNSTQFIEACQIYHETFDFCYSEINPYDKSQRGCTIDNIPNECKIGNSYCKFCVGQNCNAENLKTSIYDFHCIVCNSSNSFENSCATGKNLDKFSMKCFNISISECFTEIDLNGHTVRGCGNVNWPNRQICTTKNCNNELFPKNRTSCNQCISKDDGITCQRSLQNSTRYTRSCSKYLVNDKCYQTFDDANKIIRRGCYSDMNYPNNCHESFDCKQCNTDNCNN